MPRCVDWLPAALVITSGLVAVMAFHTIARDTRLMFSEHPSMMYRIQALADSGTWYVFESDLWNNGSPDSSAAASGVAPLSWLWRAIPIERPIHEGYALFLSIYLGLASPLVVALLTRAAGGSWFESSLTALASHVSSYQQVRSLLFEGTVGMNSAMVGAAVAGIACHRLSCRARSRDRWLVLLTIALAWCAQWPLAMPFVASVVSVTWLFSHGRYRYEYVGYVAILALILTPLLVVLATAHDSPLKAMLDRSLLFRSATSGSFLALLGPSLTSGARWLLIQPSLTLTLLLGVTSWRSSGDWPKPAVYAVAAILVIGVAMVLFPGSQSDRALLMLGPFLAYSAIGAISTALQSTKTKVITVFVVFAWCVFNYSAITVPLVSRSVPPLVMLAKNVAALPVTVSPLLITEAAMRATPDTSWAYFPILAKRRCLAARIYRDLSPMDTSDTTNRNEVPGAILTHGEDPLSILAGPSSLRRTYDDGFVLYELAPQESGAGGLK
jgi:hypothetical protein